MIGSLGIQGKHSFDYLKDEEADKEDYIHNGRNDRAAVLNVYRIHACISNDQLADFCVCFRVMT